MIRDHWREWWPGYAISFTVLALLALLLWLIHADAQACREEGGTYRSYTEPGAIGFTFDGKAALVPGATHSWCEK